MDYKRKKQKGVSLIEILIGLAIVAIIGLLAASVYFTQSRLFGRQTTQIDVATQNKLALEEMVNVIRSAESVVASCCSPVETTSADTLVLRLWTTNASGNPQDPPASPAPQDYDYIIYKRDTSDTTKLIKKTVPAAESSRPGSTDVLAIKIGNENGDLVFNLDNADPAMAREVTVTLSTEAQILNETQASTNTASAVLRNKE